MSDWNAVLSSLLLPLLAITTIVFGIRTIRRRKKNLGDSRDDAMFEAIAAGNVEHSEVYQQANLLPQVPGLEWAISRSSKRGEHSAE